MSGRYIHVGMLKCLFFTAYLDKDFATLADICATAYLRVIPFNTA